MKYKRGQKIRTEFEEARLKSCVRDVLSEDGYGEVWKVEFLTTHTFGEALVTDENLITKRNRRIKN